MWESEAAMASLQAIHVVTVVSFSAAAATAAAAAVLVIVPRTVVCSAEESVGMESESRMGNYWFPTQKRSADCIAGRTV